MKLIGLIGLLIVVVILGIIFGPFIFLWSVKEIAPGLGVEYNVGTWFAALLLIVFFLGGSSVGGSSSKK